MNGRSVKALEKTKLMKVILNCTNCGKNKLERYTFKTLNGDFDIDGDFKISTNFCPTFIS